MRFVPVALPFSMHFYVVLKHRVGSNIQPFSVQRADVSVMYWVEFFSEIPIIPTICLMHCLHAVGGSKAFQPPEQYIRL